MSVLLLNPNTNSGTTAAMVSIAASTESGLRFVGRTAPFGSAMIIEPTSLSVGAEAVAALIDDALATRETIEGVIVAAFGDPGLDEIRQRLPVPACGIGEASFLDAANGGRRFAVATTTPALEEAIAARVAHAGLAGCFAGSFFTDAEPLAAVADSERLVELLKVAVQRAGEAGAQAVIIGGGPLATAAARLRVECGLPIIEPVPAAARRIKSMIEAAPPAQ